MNNIEDYYYFVVKNMYKDYIEYIEKSKGIDPDFPGMTISFKE